MIVIVTGGRDRRVARETCPGSQVARRGRLVRLDAELKLWLAKNPDAVAKDSENDEDETSTQGAQE